MPCDIINVKTGQTDSSWSQPWAAELMLRNLNKYRKDTYKLDINYKKTFVDNGNRPSEAQLYRINQLELAFEEFTGITKVAATKYINQHMPKGYKDSIFLEPPTDEEKYIMSLPLNY